MGGPARGGDRLRVVLAAEHRLVAQAVREALEHHEVHVDVLRWREPVPAVALSTQLTGAHAGVGLFVGQPTLGLPLIEALWLFDQTRLPWVVMTSHDLGPLGGALVQHGAALVVHGTVPLEKLVEMLGQVGAGAGDPEQRLALLDQWQSQSPALRLLVAQMRLLSPRERQVLSLLHQGLDVASIAGLIGVERGTVRSQVKGLLRKLDVRSQREAVLTLEALQRAGQAVGAVRVDRAGAGDPRSDAEGHRSGRHG